MTEAEWLAGTDPAPMLEYLRGKASDRKLRLFACGVCRSAWDGITYLRSRRAVETAERYADGQADDNELSRAWSLAQQAASDIQRQITRSRMVLRHRITLEEARLFMAADTCHVHRPFLIGRLQRNRNIDEFITHGPGLLRDTFGNPVRPVTADPRWLTSTAVGLAQAIYADHAFDRLPILADALEEVGCDSPDILNHLRSDGPHVRGCWAVDLVLGKD